MASRSALLGDGASSAPARSSPERMPFVCCSVCLESLSKSCRLSLSDWPVNPVPEINQIIERFATLARFKKKMTVDWG